MGCPVPFFGRIDSYKPLIFTLGSNLSDREFLSNGKPVSPLRFLNPSLSYSSKDLFEVCCHYFNNNPYKGWFGNKGGAKVEGFLNVIRKDASYYGCKSYQAIHVDLIPFPTLAKYSCFKVCHPTHISRMLSLGKDLLDILINDYQPEGIICIGMESCSSLKNAGKRKTAGRSFHYYKGSINGVKAFGTTVYYPNPYGSTPLDWKNDLVPLM